MFILYSRQTSTTGRVLARYLGIRGGIEPPVDRMSHLIRWGSSATTPRRAESVLNKRTSILRTVHKLDFLEEARKNNIVVPDFIRLTPENIRRIEYPCLARTTRHMQGTDIMLCLQQSDAARALDLGAEYLIKYIPTKQEYRIHVFGQRAIKASVKTLVDEDMYLQWIRNFDHGHVFKYPGENNVPRTVRMAAIGAVVASGLDFGAVDIIYSDAEIPYVLEINTGPGLVASGIRKYGENFAQWLGIQDLHPEVLEGLEQTNEDNDD